MGEPAHRDTHHKALSINLDAAIYGTIAEIGAGQEVARWFLQVGGASGTVAKTISAYDMTFSDEIYGKVGRYVSRERLEGMLAKEYALLDERLGSTKGKNARFFVFADTISARNFAGTNECHGWVGLRFQPAQGAEPSDVILHLNLMDSTNLLQQQAVGVLGVNLIYGACYLHAEFESFLASLLDELSAARIQIDSVGLNGPAFAAVDPRAAHLALVRGGFSEAVLFPADGPPRPPSELLRKRMLVCEPGVFENPGSIHERMLAAATAEVANELGAPEAAPLSLFALTPRRPSEAPSASAADLLERVDALLALGSGVLVLGSPEAYRLVEYVMRYTREPVRLVFGIATVAQILGAGQYNHLDGQMLEALAKLFAFNVRVYVYPMSASDFHAGTHGTAASTWVVDADADDTIDLGDLHPPPPVSHLYAYLMQTGFLRSIGS